MPIGSYSLVPYIAHDLASHRPRRVLDLGVGFGFYGGVVRQWLDFGAAPWSTYLVGVEAWGKYANPMWDLYDLLVVDTIQGYLQRHLETFDWILLTDVIEHFTRDEGAQILLQIRGRLSPGGRFVVGTPGRFFEQGAVHGNAHETHRSIWSIEDLIGLGFQPMLSGDQPDPFGQQMVLAVWENNVSV